MYSCGYTVQQNEEFNMVSVAQLVDQAEVEVPNDLRADWGPSEVDVGDSNDLDIESVQESSGLGFLRFVQSVCGFTQKSDDEVTADAVSGADHYVFSGSYSR